MRIKTLIVSVFYYIILFTILFGCVIFLIGDIMSKSYNYNNPDNGKIDRRKVTSERLVCLAGLLYDLDRLKYGLSKMCYSDPRVSSIEKVKRIRRHRIVIKK